MVDEEPNRSQHAKYWSPLCDHTHHAEGLVNPKVRGPKTVTDFRYPRDSENIKLKIGYGSYHDQIFSKRDF
jgi:hypothetical protein